MQMRMMFVLLLIAGMSAVAPGAERKGDTVNLAGKSVVLDDALWTGCHHNAFEGHVEVLPDGSHKKGRKGQGILRTKGVLQGAGTDLNRMRLDFDLRTVPKADVRLVLKGLDDAADPQNTVAVRLNGQELERAKLFPNNDVSVTRNHRYMVGWKEVAIAVPAGALKQGTNSIEIENVSSALESAHFPFVLIDLVRLECEVPLSLTVRRPPWPIYYYGLLRGPEVNLWPSVNVGNRVCLVQGMDIEHNFFVTLPKGEPLGPNSQPATGKTDIQLHILTDAELHITDIAGTPLAATRQDGMVHYTTRVPRLVHYATPHPAQGVRVFLRPSGLFEGKQLTAWCSIDGQDYLKRTYPVRAVALQPLKDRVEGLRLSIWGGGVPREPERLQAYGRFLHSIGFNHMFTGATPELNQQLQALGFSVDSRYGWFGHKFKVSEDKAEWAAVDAAGRRSKRDFCPLAILAHPEDPEAGKYFRIAEKHARQKHIDGVCVDFECPPVWCYCKDCLALFRKETGIDVQERADVARGGEHEQAYKSFGRRRNRDLLAKVRQVMKRINPGLRYTALASACDMPSYWWDGRLRGRHSLRELAKFADEILVSAYFYNLPGGLKSVRPLIRVTKQYALDSGRDVGVGLISPLASTVSETPRYRGLALSPARLRLLLLLAGAGGAESLSLFRGDCFDGEHYIAVHETMKRLAALAPYYRQGLDRSFQLDVRPTEQGERRIHLPVNQNLLARMPWRPHVSYAYDSMQFLRDHLAKDRLVLLFNFSENPMRLQVALRGLRDPSYEVFDFDSGKALGAYSRVQLVDGNLQVTVPGSSCRVLRLVAD